MVEVKTTYPNPARPPKKYPQKDLHGRVRVCELFYKDFARFQKFYINVFGWDMIRVAKSAGGEAATSETPTVAIASGPAKNDFEAITPGHLPVFGKYSPDNVSVLLCMEMHSDPNIQRQKTLDEITSHGGKLLLDVSSSDLPVWAHYSIVEDPAGTKLKLWKCSPTRVWGVNETQFDMEE